jgi:hypothetical protein
MLNRDQKQAAETEIENETFAKRRADSVIGMTRI